MKEYLSRKSLILKIPRFFLVSILVFSWVFSGWPQIWHNLPFPPKIQKAQAAITYQQTPSEASIVPAVSISVAVNYPDDLIYDGSIGSVGLTREPLLNMKWWGIAVYTETDNFVSKCVSTASPLPTAVFNLGAGNYKTGISLGETKEDCEAFNTAEYPLFAVLEAANFNIK
ncbi:MAG: hypothetical protein WAP51_00550 [Candidatus Sungiibacteriota bacterium]